MKWTTKLSITLLHFIAEVDTLALTVGEPRQGLCGALILFAVPNVTVYLLGTY